MTKIRRQSPVKGGRDPLPSCVLHEIKIEVERLGRSYGVSRSWVIATVLADAFGIKKHESYYETEKKLRRVK